MLRVIDNRWREHLYAMDYLRESVGLRTMAGRDPLVEYKGEAFEMFSDMTFSFKEELLRYMYHIQVVKLEDQRPRMRVTEESGGGQDTPARKKPKPAQASAADKTPRNAPCPCGSGKKYKFCCGK